MAESIKRELLRMGNYDTYKFTIGNRNPEVLRFKNFYQLTEGSNVLQFADAEDLMYFLKPMIIKYELDLFIQS